MFPSSGYFRSVECPFFSSGFCERPHCHFRHVKSEPLVVNDSAPSWCGGEEESSGSGVDLLSLVRQAVLQVQKEVEADKINLQPEISQEQNKPDKSRSQDNDSEELEIRDTLLDDAELLLSDKKVLAKEKPKHQRAPEYTPTPIAKLKVLKFKQLISKREKQQPVANSNVLEYDPTETCSNLRSLHDVDYKPSPRVSCVTKPDTSSSSGQIKTKTFHSSAYNAERSDDEYIPTDVNPTFSDDEDDVKSSTVPKSKKIVINDSKEDSSEHSDDETSNFDVVKQIMVASSLCDSVISSKKKIKSKTTQNKAKSSTIKISEKNTSSSSNKSKIVTSKSKDGNTKIIKSSYSAKHNNSKSETKQIIKVNESVKKNNECSPKTKNNSHNKLKTESKISSLKSGSPKTNKEVKSQLNKADKKSDGISCKTKVPSPQKRLPSPNKSVISNGASISKSVPVVTVNKNQATESLFSDSEDDDGCDEDDDLDEHDTYEECLRIFNEYNTHKNENTTAKRKENKVEAPTEYQSVGKKRVAHEGGGDQIVKRPKQTANHQPTPSMIMQNRLIQSIQQYKENKALVQMETGINKRRIAHTPCYQPAGASLQTPTVAGPSQICKATFAPTAIKGLARQAHVPSQTVLKRPMIAAEFGCRVPINIRQRYLNLIIDNCLKLYDAEQDAFDRAVNEEKLAYERSSSRQIYLNSAAITIKRLRSEQSESQPPPLPTSTTDNKIKAKVFGGNKPGPRLQPPPQRLVSHEAILNGKKGANIPIGITNKKKLKPYEEPITDAKLYHALKKYILSKEQLETNGYPMSHPIDPSRAIILKQNTKNFKSANPLEKFCARCGKSFEVSPDGVYITQTECFYHWGRINKTRVARSIESIYSCCRERANSSGCCVAELHVFDDTDTDNLKGYVKTLPKSPPWDGNCGTFALDCEMSYTNRGVELVRVTVVGSDFKPVYETLVKPENPIIDHNTRFSGITKEDLDGVTTNIRDVQAVLLNLFNDQTILIGHSLESDLKALKIIHGTAVDTSLVFPHRLGLPYKRALRNLSAEILGKIVQNSLGGHDSQEDAVACMELMLYKVKEDMKKYV